MKRPRSILWQMLSEWSWLFWFVLIAILGIVGTLWAYDGDVKCLIAECRRMK